MLIGVSTGLRWGTALLFALVLPGCVPQETLEDIGTRPADDPAAGTATNAAALSTPDLPVVYVAATAGNDASISSPGKCNDVMGAGGNFSEGAYELRGKCNGAGLSPQIANDPQNPHFLSFTTSPERSFAGTRDRTELAYVQQYFPFYEHMYIGFRLMIPENTDATNEFFYALQLWQCAGLAPIAGVRLERGTSHTINFMTLNDRHGRSRARFDLTPGRWHSFVLSIVPGPADNALFEVLTEDDVLVESHVPYGFAAADACGEQRNDHRYRVKFGIYKGGEPGKHFTINYDDVTIADRYAAAADALCWDSERKLSGMWNGAR